MADDDEDEGFGDFKFAPVYPNHTTGTLTVDNNSNTNGRDSFFDDDWGDFVTSHPNQISNGFELSNGLNVQSSVKLSQKQEQLDFSGNFADDESVKIRIESGKAQWAKPNGALPLSLFGEMEEEKNYVGDEITVGNGAPILFQKKDDSAKKGSNVNGGVGIDDLIAKLYNQSQKINIHSGLDPNSILNGTNSITNEPSAKVDGLSSKTNGLNSNVNEFDSIFGGAILNSNGLDSNISVMESNSNGLNLDTVAENEEFEDDDDGWEFKAAESGKQEERVVESPGVKVDAITWDNLDTKVVGMENVNVKGSGHTLFSNSNQGPVDMLMPSNGVSNRNDEWNFVFDFNSSSVTQDDSLLDSNSESKKNDTNIASNFSPVVENVDPNQNFWEFKDAFSEVRQEAKLEGSKVGTFADVGHNLNGNGAHNPTEFFVASNGSSHDVGEWDIAFASTPHSVNQDGIISDSYTNNKKNDIGQGACFPPDDMHDDSDDDFCEFRDAYSENGSKHEGESVITHDPPANMLSPVFNGVTQHNDTKLENHREALPLSIFGDEELETNTSPIHQDVSIDKLASDPKSSISVPGSNLSLNDLISSLFSHSEQNTSVNHTPNISENAMPSAMEMLEPDNVNHDDGFDDDSWEFKDASSVIDIEALPGKSSSKLQLTEFVDIYCKLKDESCFLALSLFEKLKEAQSSVAPFGEEVEFEALGEEIQKLHSQLHQDTVVSQIHSENLSSKTACLGELLKVMQESKFRVLESEYQLSKQLSLAENDLRSAIELSKHATSTLRILNLGLAKEQSNYVSSWSKIVSTCAEELRHGAFIWKQSLQKNIHEQILSEPQGRQYILALGEIYRVVEVLRASTTVYKPWVLLHTADPIGFFALINECSTLWSSSGLHEGLHSISEVIESEPKEASKALLDSLKYIQNLDLLALQNHICSGQQPTCRLSMLTAGAMPGIKMVVWDGKDYFVTLANLWANLISSSPPDLPHLNVS
ncbi:hypothetical protein UlMin_029264 [Ulmus minor]